MGRDDAARMIRNGSFREAVALEQVCPVGCPGSRTLGRRPLRCFGVHIGGAASEELAQLLGELLHEVRPAVELEGVFWYNATRNRPSSGAATSD